MLDNYVRKWKQWIYNVKTKSMELLVWTSGKNDIISLLEKDSYRVVEYTSNRFHGATLKPGPKWKYATKVTPVLADKSHAESVAYNYWLANASYTLIDKFDLLVAVRIVSKQTGEVIPEIAPVIWWGTEIPGDPRDLPTTTWKRPKH